MFKRNIKKASKDRGFLSEESFHDLRIKNSAISCGDVEHRRRSRVVGQVTSLRIVPRGKSQWLEVVIKDGTGIINGWFFGRKEIPGMAPGANVLFEGLVQLDEGEMTIANPYYEYL